MPSSPASMPNPVAVGCPRCALQLSPPDLVKHLWIEHRLLLEDGEPRDPWHMIDGWVSQYCKDGNPELLERCRALSARVDPELGLLRVRRFFLKHGVQVGEAKATLLAEARVRHAAVCPHCFALVPADEDPPVRPLVISRGRLSGAGYRVEVFERTLRSRLEIETPAGVIYRGPEPGRGWNFRGLVLVCAGLPVLMALILACILPFLGIHPLWAVGPLLVAAALGYGLVQSSWRSPGPAAGRAVDLAWGLAVPRLHQEGFRTADSAFLAGLALTSAAGLGRPHLRAEPLQRLLFDTKKAVAAGIGSVAHLAALWRLAIFDTAALGGDPVSVVVTQVSHYFNNKIPLVFVEHLLAGCRGDTWLVERREQLRILLLERAFEAGLEVRELTAIGQAAPELRHILRTDDADGLARLRLLWSMRPRRPWDRGGQAVTAFDLAATARDAALLQRIPDLLLEATEAPDVRLTNRGLIFQGKVFAELPRRIEVRRAGQSTYSLLVDEHSLPLPAPPRDQVVRFQRWCQFFFQEFLPEVPKVHQWQAPNAPPLTMKVAVRCPECRHALLPRAGELATEVNPEAFGLSADGE